MLREWHETPTEYGVIYSRERGFSNFQSKKFFKNRKNNPDIADENMFLYRKICVPQMKTEATSELQVIAVGH